MYAITFIFTSNAQAWCPRKPSKKKDIGLLHVSQSRRTVKVARKAWEKPSFSPCPHAFGPPRGRLKGIFASIWQETSTRFPPGSFFIGKLMTNCVNIDRIQSGQKSKFHEIELEK